jgi:hypothetical protein
VEQVLHPQLQAAQLLAVVVVVVVLAVQAQ